MFFILANYKISDTNTIFWQLITILHFGELTVDELKQSHLYVFIWSVYQPEAVGLQEVILKKIKHTIE